MGRSNWYIKTWIPGAWFEKAMRTGGHKAAAVVLFLWYCRALDSRNPFRLKFSHLPRFGVDKRTVNRTLATWSDAGLVSVIRNGLRSRRVEILDDAFLARNPSGDFVSPT